LARDFAALFREDRAKTPVLDPTRQGGQELTDAIRAALVTDGTPGEDAMVASVLESRDPAASPARHLLPARRHRRPQQVGEGPTPRRRPAPR
ncbi:hypothetical protein M4Q69_11420, partial [Streptococcus agalactiae]|uniref:hypothetical protein n=1 Tax=Streptococcus agalactiae TaxID=1311 RepID=UPI0020C08752